MPSPARETVEKKPSDSVSPGNGSPVKMGGDMAAPEEELATLALVSSTRDQYGFPA